MVYNKEVQQVVTVCSEPVIRVWESETGKAVYHIPKPHGVGVEVTALALDSTEYRLATAAQDGNLQLLSQSTHPFPV